MRASTVLASWAKIPGLVPKEKALEILNAGGLAKGKGKALVPDLQDEVTTASSGVEYSDVEIIE